MQLSGHLIDNITHTCHVASSGPKRNGADPTRSWHKSQNDAPNVIHILYI